MASEICFGHTKYVMGTCLVITVMSEILPGENPLFWQQFFTEFCRQKNYKKITDGRVQALLALSPANYASI